MPQAFRWHPYCFPPSESPPAYMESDTGPEGQERERAQTVVRAPRLEMGNRDDGLPTSGNPG